MDEQQVKCPFKKLFGENLDYCTMDKHNMYFYYKTHICTGCRHPYKHVIPMLSFPSACSGRGLFEFSSDLSYRMCYFALPFNEI